VGRVNDPEKNFMDCIAYIKKKALEWLKEQQKIELSSYAQGVGGDVPNDICYQWAVEYYYSKPEPKPEPKKADTASTKSKGKSGKKDTDKTEKAEAISLFDEPEKLNAKAAETADPEDEEKPPYYDGDEDDIEFDEVAI
jgi:hypothetical protein